MGSLSSLDSAPQATGNVLRRTLLTSLTGVLGSVFGLPAQSADRLTHPAGGYGWGQVISLVTPKSSQGLSPVTDSCGLSPCLAESSYSPFRGPFSSQLLGEASLIPGLGNTPALASLGPSHDPGLCAVQLQIFKPTGQSSLRTANLSSLSSGAPSPTALSKCSSRDGLGTQLSLGRRMRS